MDTHRIGGQKIRNDLDVRRVDDLHQRRPWRDRRLALLQHAQHTTGNRRACVSYLQVFATGLRKRQRGACHLRFVLGDMIGKSGRIQ